MAGRASRTPNRWGEGDRLRAEILAAASRQLSALDGEDALTIRGVARDAGIAPASIYQHFADRGALVDALSGHEYAALRARMAAAGDASADTVGGIRAQLHAYCTFAIERPGIYRLMLARGSTRTAPGERRSGPMIDLIDALAEAFARCAAAGQGLRVPPERAAAITFVGAHGRVALLHSGNGDEASVADVLPFVDELLALVLA